MTRPSAYAGWVEGRVIVGGVRERHQAAAAIRTAFKVGVTIRRAVCRATPTLAMFASGRLLTVAMCAAVRFATAAWVGQLDVGSIEGLRRTTNQLPSGSSTLWRPEIDALSRAVVVSVTSHLRGTFHRHEHKIGLTDSLSSTPIFCARRWPRQ